MAQPSIQTTPRSDRGLPMSLLQMLIRPFGEQLVTPKSQFPAGSPRLTAHSSARKKCKVTERNVADCWIYDLEPTSSVSAAHSHHDDSSQSPSIPKGRRRLYYFSGGAWQMVPSSEHWSFCAWLSTHLPGVQVSIVSYPLAPNTPCPQAFSTLMRLYESLLAEAGEQDEVILAGDSAGGNLILALTCEALRLNRERDLLGTDSRSAGHRAPSRLMLISPAVDLRNTNPEMQAVALNDPLLNVRFVTWTADTWRAEWSAEDPRVSPVLADQSLLASAGVTVDGVVGGWDVLSPDALVLKEKLAESGVDGSWLVWDRMMHCWPLARRFGLRESKVAALWILERLKA